MRRPVRFALLASLPVLLMALALPAFVPAADLADTMGELRGQLKALNGALAAKDEPASLRAVSEMQRLALVAKDAALPGLDKRPADQRAAQAKAYRKELLGLLRQLADLEDEVLDGRWDEALQRATVTLKSVRDAAHEKFQDKG